MRAGCGHENPSGARFCGECGAALAATCAACGAPNPSGQKFCTGCGQPLVIPAAFTPPHLAEKILSDRKALEGERRTVTVLFADTVGSTPLAERIDEEVMYDLMQGGLKRMMECVHRFEGTITQFRGDGVMALFGAPIAHEDSARRAVAAALDMQRALEEFGTVAQERHGVAVRFRVGLHTGPVVVGQIGDDLAMDFTAIGDTANLAARMEELADPGSVYLSERTHRAVADYFDCEALGPKTVKGKAEPILAFKALGELPVRSRLEAAASRGLTPFVGRTHELSNLRDFFERASRGQGQVVFVSGEAGIGKSRLLLELRQSLDGADVGWAEGHCTSYGRTIPYLPVIDILKRAYAIQEGDDDTTIIGRVEEAARDWEPGNEHIVPYLKFLLQVDPGDDAVAAMDPMERRAGVLHGLRTLLCQASHRRPQIVVVEDLHWIDPQSEEALAALMDVVSDERVLMVLTYRPGYSPTFGDRTYFSRLALGHLHPEDSVAVAQGVLHTGTLPEDLQRLIGSKAEGNPFFIEEVTKSLVESGFLRETEDGFSLERPGSEIRIPDTIQEVILARIDRLEREAKEAIQLASVIGREFTVRLLHRISDVESELSSVLTELKALELIYEKAYFPELAYMFKHALTHDVAYSTLLVERRKALHRFVAVAIEELYAERLPEQYETLAYHYELGEEWDKALHYLDLAGDKASAAFANQQAVDFFARALIVCDKLGDHASAAGIAHKRGYMSMYGVGDIDGALSDFARMGAEAALVGDVKLESMALGLRAMCLYWAHEFEEAEDAARAGLDLAGTDRDARLVSSLWMWGSLGARDMTTEIRAVVSDLRRLVETGAGDPFSRAFFGLSDSITFVWDGDYAPAKEISKRWLGDAHATGQIVNAIGLYWTSALALGGGGSYEAAIAMCAEGLSVAERVGESIIRARLMNTMGWLLAELEDHERSSEWNTRGLEFARSLDLPDPEVECNALLNLGDNHRALGRVDEAAACYAEVEHVVRNPRPQDRFMLWHYSQHMCASSAELWLARGDAGRALAYADECIARAGSTGRKKNVVKGKRVRGNALAALGEREEAGKELTEALTLAEAIGNPAQLWRCHVALGAFGEALGVIERVAAGLSDDHLRDTFLGSPHVSAIRAAAGA